MTEIVDERKRLVVRLRAAIAAVDRFANREYVEGFDSEYAQLIRGVVRPFTEAADQIEADGKRLAELVEEAQWRGRGNDQIIDRRDGWKDRAERNERALASRPQEQPRKATGEWHLVRVGGQVPLAACPIGLFERDGEVCLRTEYSNNEGQIDAYIVSSGEYFWGDYPQTIASQRAQLVQPLALSVSPAQGWQTVPADEALIRHMVDRFLMWKLPTHFRPDDGISFDPISSRGTKYERRREPTGTNLFDVDQATAMVRHMLDEAPAAAPPSAVPLAVSVSPAAAQGWQPRETAPKNGTLEWRVLMHWRDMGSSSGWVLTEMTHWRPAAPPSPAAQEQKK